MATDHALRLGKLLGNLQSLEVVLRVYLLKAASRPPSSGAPKKPYWDLAVGDVVDDDEFTNFDTLGKLVAKYNADIQHKDQTLVVDLGVVEVRDLLVHGRVAGSAEDTTTLKILKFHKPVSGKAVVSACALMSDSWFEVHTASCYKQIQRVAKAIDTHAI
jgi:hypothetical protein